MRCHPLHHSFSNKQLTLTYIPPLCKINQPSRNDIRIFTHQFTSHKALCKTTPIHNPHFPLQNIPFTSFLNFSTHITTKPHPHPHPHPNPPHPPPRASVYNPTSHPIKPPSSSQNASQNHANLRSPSDRQGPITRPMYRHPHPCHVLQRVSQNSPHRRHPTCCKKPCAAACNPCVRALAPASRAKQADTLRERKKRERGTEGCALLARLSSQLDSDMQTHEQARIG
ncbi:hypothetical protein GQ607_012676 [Colletotrichum asianum]|uniref:Uncharacterized protein n=1 Tax=Colletotrichum asianum TaxID=702518 RepID=A0A8H3W6B4_9PEZI|nr:hypothetical protein GQ607_012676 [Colletotrichum asianum]